MISKRTLDGVVIMEVPNRIDEALMREAAELLEAGNRHLVLDLNRLTFVESNGLGALVNVYKLTQSVQGRFGIYGVQPYVRKLVDITRLNRILAIYESEDEAVAAQR